MSFVPFSKYLLEVGKPLIASLYNSEGVLLLSKGLTITNEHLLEKLLNIDLYYDEKEMVSQNYKKTITKKVNNKVISHQKNREEADKTDKNIQKKVMFDKIKLSIDDPISLQVNDGISSDKFLCKFFGYIKNKSIMISHPMLGNDFAFIREGQDFVLRFVACTSTVLKIVYTPYTYVHLSFPKEVIAVPIRQNFRADVKIIGVTSKEGEEQQNPTIIKNLSSSGCLLSSKLNIAKVGEICSLKFRLTIEGIEHIYNLPIKIRRHSVKDEIHEYGITFEDLSPQDIISLSAYVYKVLLDTDE